MFKIGVGAVILILFTIGLADIAHADDGCFQVDRWGGGCEVSGSVVGDAVEVSAETRGGGGSGDAGSGDSGGDSSEGGGESADGPGAVPPVVPVVGQVGVPVSRRAVETGHQDGGGLACGSTVVPCAGPPAAPGTPGAPGAPVVTMADIAAFRPVPPVQGMDPSGWAVAGLPANFYASAPPSTVAGTLLGAEARVRFTPVRFRWDFGDGSGLSSRSPGASWAALGVAEFEPTPSSHVYRATGTVRVRLSVSYAAEYSFAGGGWTPIAGTLTVSANELSVVVSTAETVLVARDCSQAPRGPGC